MTTPPASKLLILLAAAVSLAEAAPRDAMPAPDADFLEFLGSWHVGDERWIDPFQLDDPPGIGSSGRSQDATKDEGARTRQPTGPQDDARPRQSDRSHPRRDVMP
ncbi:hypothetical protein [Nitrospira moscoviensis]|uniref:Uncharacterized protein n=1 Tax=Nitrospira moscoviensis TaxID=42253 RepID=A0A0K2GJ15_NITMO|nr:hypothetical protein [Nitrospira moscoviensis]ALA60938.1 conserved exported protein of unknown function [Nitrospira moscoviensis]